MRAELLGGPRPRGDRRDRGRDPEGSRLHAARRRPRRLDEPHRLHARRRARRGRRGRARRGPRRPLPDRHAEAARGAPARRGDGRLPVRPRLGRDDGRLRTARERVRRARRRRARHPCLPVRPRGAGRAPADAPADPGGGVRGARRPHRPPGVEARLRPRGVRAGVGCDVRGRPRLPDRVQRQRPRDEGAGAPHRARRPRAGARAGPARAARGRARDRLVGRGVRPRPGVDKPRGLSDDPAARRLRGVRRGGAQAESRGGGVRARGPHSARRRARRRRALHREGGALHPRRASEGAARGRSARPVVGAAVRAGEADRRVHDPGAATTSRLPR